MINWPMGSGKLAVEDEIHTVTAWMTRYTIKQKRSFFMTETGYMGLGPALMQPGDKVCVLYGWRTPMLLREVGESNRFVGECYVYGMMMGEMIVEVEAGRLVGEGF